MLSSPRGMPSVSSAAVHFWWAAIVAVVLTPILGVLTLWLSFLFAHATTPAQVVILRILFGPVSLVADVAPNIPFLVLYFLIQFPFLWLIAFLVIRAYSWLVVQLRREP